MRYIYVWIEAVLLSITLMEGIEITVKVITGIMAIVVGIFAILHYNTRRKLDQIQIDKEKLKIKSNGKI